MTIELIFVDGCDGYDADADVIDRWDFTDPAEFNYDASAGRFGGGAIVWVDDQLDLRKAFPVAGAVAATDELFIGISFFATTITTTDNIWQLFGPSGTLQMSMQITSTGQLKVIGAGVNEVTAAGTIVGGQYFRIEMKGVYKNSGGLIEVKLNNDTVINVSGVDTQVDALPGVTGVRFGGAPAGAWTMDDFIFHKGNATDFMGDVEIQTIFPDAVGDSSDGTPTSGDNFANVNETGANDGDTTVVTMSTALDEDLYNMESLPSSADDVFAVVVNHFARSSGTTGRTMRAKVKSGATEGNGVTKDVPLGANFGFLQEYFPTNPDTASAWTESEVNGMQLGQEVIV